MDPEARQSDSEKANTWTMEALKRGNIEAIHHRINSDPGYLEERDEVGNTPLMTAIDFDHLEGVQYLLQRGANPNADAEDGYTCLLSAIESEGPHSIAIVEQLLQAGADPRQAGINGWTPLHLAAVRGEVAKAEQLLEAGVEVDARKMIDGQETPLMEAAWRGLPAMVQFLLKWGADPLLREHVNEHDALAIAEYAAAGPDPDVIHHLQQLAPLNLEELFAGQELNEEVQAALADAVSELDMVESYRRSAEEIAANGQHDEVIRILREYRGRS